MGEIKYVQLEAGDFLADPDFQLMTDAERGIYTSIIFYMYNNDGKIQNDPQRIKSLTNSGENFEKSWKTVRKKFTEKGGYLTHKRVRKELAKAKRYIQTQRRAGLRGAQKRWGGHSDPIGVDMPKPMAIKEKESKKKRVFKPPTLEEVIEYVKEKSYQVDVKKFMEYYIESNWHDRDGKPVRSWKQKIIAVWNKPGDRKICRSSGCKGYGVYTSTDDTGQTCWWCENHKPRRKPCLPSELTSNVLKTVPGKDKRSTSDKQNEQMRKLAVKTHGK